MENTAMDKKGFLKQYWGYDNFRPHQEDIIDHVLAGKDTLVLMPTGGGKSICYQIPALMLPGLTVVISPLISLMKDQVEALKANGISAHFLNSSQTASEQGEIEKECEEGKVKVLYVSPEKIVSQGFSYLLRQLKVSLFAIDEAHCVSFWGHDFRKEYTQLKNIRQQFPGIPFIALTATADKVTRKDIRNQLGMEKAKVFISSFDRPNLSLSVMPGRNRLKHILNFLNARKGQSGIIYCLSRKNCEQLAEKLRANGHDAQHYHAGMGNEARAKCQEDFIKDEVQIICATIAFGMGIDKPNVRWVIHYNLPKNVESFYQEIGRAGRDGLASDTLLFYSFQDYSIYLNMLSELHPNQKELQMAKLDRMKQYAEAVICRRRILLSYFNEDSEKDCGNCDVCKNPPTRFDGTVPAQKALSAIARTEEKVGHSMLVNILRGSSNRDLLEKGYQNIKTFGAGRELRFDEWFDYIMQMLNSGVMDIAYDENNVFKLNDSSLKILKGKRKVELVKFVPFAQRKAVRESQVVEKSATEIRNDKLFERLKILRKELAEQQNVPAYIIFNDATLTDLVKNKPVSPIEFKNIQGVGETKFRRYGEQFLNEIASFVQDEAQQGTKLKGSTYLATYNYFKQGFSVEEIGKKRNLSPVTIYSHLAYLYEKGHDIELSQFLQEEAYQEIRKAIDTVQPENNQLKPVFEHLDGKYEYYQIRLAFSMMAREEVV